MSTYIKILVGFCAALGLTPMAGSAEESFQSHGSIQAAARTFLVEHLQRTQGVTPEVEDGHLDPRLQLADCTQPLEAFLPPGGRASGNTTVGVRCPGAQPWTLYVPVRVAVTGPVVVVTRPLARGALIGDADLQVVERDLAQLPFGHLQDPARVAGMQLLRPVSAGTALTPGMLEAPRLIRRGQQVTLLATAGSVEVRMSGTALGDGAEGERVRVRNLNSKRVIEGVVTAAGQIQVDM
jgi:flagella basal body P-ring formation protein FlgA